MTMSFSIELAGRGSRPSSHATTLGSCIPRNQHQMLLQHWCPTPVPGTRMPQNLSAERIGPHPESESSIGLLVSVTSVSSESERLVQVVGIGSGDMHENIYMGENVPRNVHTRCGISNL